MKSRRGINTAQQEDTKTRFSGSAEEQKQEVFCFAPMDDNNDDGNSNNGEVFPQDVLINILKRLPVKTLVRFNCVSKGWGKLFKTPHFIAQHLHYSVRHNSFLIVQHSSTPFHLLQSPDDFRYSSYLFGPDLKVHDSQFLDFISPQGKIVMHCNGLLCLIHGGVMTLCNPATRQIRQVPPKLNYDGEDVVMFSAFGFSPAVDDYKIVQISVVEFVEGGVEQSHVRRVDVYSLTTGSWKEIDFSSMQNWRPVSMYVAMDGVLYWLAQKNSEFEVGDMKLVLSFDIEKEVFSLFKGPEACPSFSLSYDHRLTIHNNKLAIFCRFNMMNCSFTGLWVLDNTHADADGEGWINQCSHGFFWPALLPLSFWKDEIVCLEELHDEFHRPVGSHSITLFNPCINELKRLDANKYYSCPLNYVESLVQVANI